MAVQRAEDSVRFSVLLDAAKEPLSVGRSLVDEKGANKWDSTATGHFHLVVKSPPAEVQDLINNLIMHQPKK